MPSKTTTTKKDVSPIERFREVFTAIEAPKGGLPTMPTVVSSVPSDKLGDMISRYSAWREFTEDRHLEACAVFSQTKSEYDLASDKEMIHASASTVTERKAEARNNPKVAKLYEKLTEAEIFRDLLASKLDSFSNVLAMLSRELTRRGVQTS